MQLPFALRPAPPWQDVTGKPISPSACPFYLGRLADDSDVQRALPHFRRGTLRAWLGREPDPVLLDCLESHEAGENDWAHDPALKKAGA